MEILLPSLRIIESFDMRAKIIKIGNSLGIIIPHKILKQLLLKESDELELELRGPRLIMEPVGVANNPFAILDHGGWYDDPRDSWVIAEELRSSRVDSREEIEL